MNREEADDLARKLLATDGQHNAHVLIDGGSVLVETVPEARAFYAQYFIAKDEDKTMEPTNANPVEAITIETAPTGLPGLTEGRNCHYVAYNGRHLAAMVIGHDSSKSYSNADLVVFTNMENVNGVKNFGMQFHQDIAYSEQPLPGTYHWIERA